MVATVRPGKFLAEPLKALAKRRSGTRAAIQLAIDDTTKQLRTQAGREIRSQIAIKTADLKPRLRRKLAYRRGLSGTLFVDGRQVKLSRFRQRQTADGVAVTIMRSAGPAIFPGTFGPRAPERLKGGVYRRESDPRFPIGATPGPHLAAAAVAVGAVERTKRKIKDLFPKNLERRLRRLAGQGGA